MQSNLSNLNFTDLNNDGYWDFVASSSSSGASPTIGIVTTVAGGGFGTPNALTGRIDSDSSNTAHAGLDIGDLDGDGYVDLIGMRQFSSSVNNQGGGGLHFYRGNGTTSPVNPTYVFVPACYGPYSEGLLSVFDMNQDGKLDIVNTNSYNSTTNSASGIGINWNRSN